MFAYLAIGLLSPSEEYRPKVDQNSQCRQKSISVAGISAEGSRGKMIFTAFRVKAAVRLLRSLHEFVQPNGGGVLMARLLISSLEGTNSP